MIRLDKYLADMGVGTRAEVKKYIKQGKVTVDGAIVKSAELKIDQEVQQVMFQGSPIGYEEFEYYMLHKPAGVISATTDTKDKTVVDLISDKKRKDLFPVGRLDKDTTGLMIITDDGVFAHNILSPSKHITKTYNVTIDIPITEEMIIGFKEGIKLNDGECKPSLLEKTSTYTCLVTLTEGRYHQIKRMFGCFGAKVIELQRIKMGSLELPNNLLPGEIRELTIEELEQIQN